LSIATGEAGEKRRRGEKEKRRKGEGGKRRRGEGG